MVGKTGPHKRGEEVVIEHVLVGVVPVVRYVASVIVAHCQYATFSGNESVHLTAIVGPMCYGPGVTEIPSYGLTVKVIGCGGIHLLRLKVVRVSYTRWEFVSPDHDWL